MLDDPGIIDDVAIPLDRLLQDLGVESIELADAILDEEVGTASVHLDIPVRSLQPYTGAVISHSMDGSLPLPTPRTNTDT